MSPSTVLLAALLLFGYGTDYIAMPFESNVRTAFDSAAPWFPALVATWFLQDIIKALLIGAGRGVGVVARFIVAVALCLLFLVFIFPIMIADTFLLGPVAHWLWQHQVGPVTLVVLSALAYYAWGGETKEYVRKYLLYAAIGGAVIIALRYAAEQALNTRRVVYRVSAPGVLYANPPRSIFVDGGADGAEVVFSAFGRIVAGGVNYPPGGNAADPVPDPHSLWYVGRGQIKFLVFPFRGAPPVEVPVEPLQEGIVAVAGLDAGYYAGGYYLRARALIPPEVKGWLGVGFQGITPDDGFVRLVISLNTRATKLGMRYVVGWIGVAIIFAAIYALLAAKAPLNLAFLKFLLIIIFGAVLYASGDVSAVLRVFDGGVVRAIDTKLKDLAAVSPSTSATAAATTTPTYAAPVADPCVYEHTARETMAGTGKGREIFLGRVAGVGQCKKVTIRIKTVWKGDTKDSVLFPYSLCREGVRPIMTVPAGWRGATISQGGVDVPYHSVNPADPFFLLARGAPAAVTLECPS